MKLKTLVVAVGVALSAFALNATDYYVDADHGVDNAEHDGSSPALAKKTLAAAMAIAGLKSGDTVWAAAGVYKDGTMLADDWNDARTAVTMSDVPNRVVVPDGVTLRSVEGPEKTVILGAAATSPVNAYGCGPDSLRCVCMAGKDSRLVGFTLTGGRARMDTASSGTAGGGIRQYVGSQADLSSYSHAINCIITNNVAQGGGGGYYGCYDSCRIVGNRSADSTAGSATGGSIRHLLCDCYVNGNEGGIAQAHQMRECNGVTFGPTGDYSFWWRGDAGCTLRDCVVLRSPRSWKSSEKMYLKHCFFSKDAVTDASGGVRESQSLVIGDPDCEEHAFADFKLDESGRPAKDSCVVDVGSNNYHSATCYDDCFGVPRILNSRIDVGAYEYDWRKDYAHDLGNRLRVPAATSDVVETDARTVRLTADQRLTVKPADERHAQAGCGFPYVVSGGTLTITVNGVVVATATADGTWEYKDGKADDVIEFSFVASAADGHADLQRTSGNVGLILLFR